MMIGRARGRRSTSPRTFLSCRRGGIRKVPAHHLAFPSRGRGTACGGRGVLLNLCLLSIKTRLPRRRASHRTLASSFPAREGQGSRNLGNYKKRQRRSNLVFIFRSPVPVCHPELFCEGSMFSPFLAFVENAEMRSIFFLSLRANARQSDFILP